MPWVLDDGIFYAGGPQGPVKARRLARIRTCLIHEEFASPSARKFFAYKILLFSCTSPRAHASPARGRYGNLRAILAKWDNDICLV
jgi:hypothetical protein